MNSRARKWSLVARLVRGGTARRCSSRRSLLSRAGLPNPRAAFTLLELIIATAVGGIVLLAVQTSFFGALRLHETTHARLDTDLALQRALGIVRRDLAGVMLPGGTLSGQLQTSNFSSALGDAYGERISPDLHTTSGRIDGWNPFSEVQRVAYFLAPAQDSSGARDLVRVVQRNLLPAQDDSGAAQVILRGLTAAALLFHDGVDWTDTWDSEASSTLPTGLKFQVTLASRDPSQPAQAPVEIVVPVVVTTTQSATETAAAAPAP
ncbi:MAG: prepilin-type N-terminal cleavage/methylation domain-containing protein [Opitutaceae bacterium]|nr:prepilin-type N-terminal cleavage/methylation domain-containing protein [Opitutaceae bacterium]